MHIVSMTDGRMIVLSEGMAKRISKAITSGTTRLMGYILEDGTVLTTAHIVAIYNEKTDFHNRKETDSFISEEEIDWDRLQRQVARLKREVASAPVVIKDTDNHAGSEATEPIEEDSPPDPAPCPHTAIEPRYRVDKAGIKRFFNLCECGWKSRYIAKAQVENPDGVLKYQEIGEEDVPGAEQETEGQES